MSETHPLRVYREKQTPRLSQEALAQQLGVARLTVLRWENGEHKIDRTLLRKVAKKTGIPPKKLRPDLVSELEQLIRGDQ